MNHWCHARLSIAALLAVLTLGGCASLTLAGGTVVSDGEEVRGRVSAVKIGG